MAKKVTLYIEDTDIKLLVTKGKQIDKWASLLLEPSLVRDGVIVDEDEVAKSIKNLMKLGEVGTRKVDICLSGLNSIFRIITLPELNQSLLPEAVMNEARRVLPVPLEQVYINYQQLPSTKGETRLFLAAYPRNSTDVLIKTIAKAGLKTDMVDMAPLALARCVNEPRAIIINSWLTYIDIIIMVDRLPQVIRSLSLPTESVAIEEKLPFIAEELARTVAFYNSSNPTNQLDSGVPVFVCGDLVDAPDSWQTLVGQYEYSVSPVAPPIQYPDTFSPGKFMVNVGASLRGQLPGGEGNNFSIIDINALPEAYQPVSFSITRVIAPVAIVIGLGALFYGGMFVKDISDETTAIRAQIDNASIQSLVVEAQIGHTEADIDEVEAVIAQYPEQIAQIESQIQAVEARDERFAYMLSILGDKLEKTNANLAEVISLLPANIEISSVQYDGEDISLSGVAMNEDDIFSYARALRESELFNEVIVMAIQEVYKEEYEVEIRTFTFNFLIY